jgi:hypothetical protein
MCVCVCVCARARVSWARAATAATARQNKLRVVCIAGPTASGKTTFSHKLALALRAEGISASPLTVDHYYLPLDRQPKYQVSVRTTVPPPPPLLLPPPPTCFLLLAHERRGRVLKLAWVWGRGGVGGAGAAAAVGCRLRFDREHGRGAGAAAHHGPHAGRCRVYPHLQHEGAHMCACAPMCLFARVPVSHTLARSLSSARAPLD